MSFNYVLLTKDYTSRKFNLVDLYSARINAVIHVNAAINSLFDDYKTETANSKLMDEDHWFGGKTSYYLAHKNNNEKLVIEPIKWGELAIKGQNGQDYIDNLKRKKEAEIQKQTIQEEKREKKIKEFISKHRLPISYYDNKWCWCAIDLDAYREILENDNDEILNAGEYAEYAYTIFRDDQIDVFDALSNFPGKIGILLGKTKSFTEQYGLKGKKQEYVRPFNSDNCLYAFTDSGISKLKADAEFKGLSKLYEWCGDKLSNYIMPGQDTPNSMTRIYDALPSILIEKNDDKKISIFDAINSYKGSNSYRDMFLNYFEGAKNEF